MKCTRVWWDQANIIQHLVLMFPP